jgi:hypothetical protein
MMDEMVLGDCEIVWYFGNMILWSRELTEYAGIKPLVPACYGRTDIQLGDSLALGRTSGRGFTLLTLQAALPMQPTEVTHDSLKFQFDSTTNAARAL